MQSYIVGRFRKEHISQLEESIVSSGLNMSFGPDKIDGYIVANSEGSFDVTALRQFWKVYFDLIDIEM